MVYITSKGYVYVEQYTHFYRIRANGKKLKTGIVDPIRDNILKKYQLLFHSFKFSAVLVVFTVIFGTLYFKVSFAIVRGSKIL